MSSKIFAKKYQNADNSFEMKKGWVTWLFIELFCLPIC